MSDAGGTQGDDEIARSVVTEVEGRVSAIEILESRPKNITFHSIGDHQLEMLMNISRPVALAVSTTSIGAFLGLLPSMAAIANDVGNIRPLNSFDLLLVAIAGACLAVGLTAGVFAWRGQMQARRTLAAIRARETHVMIRVHAG